MALVISETAVSMWHYHLRLVGGEGIRLGGYPGLKALCGHPVGWDTEIPLEHYDPERKPERICDGVFCRRCWEESKRLGLR